MSHSAVTKYLKILEEAEIVGYKKGGLWVNRYLTGCRDNPHVVGLLENLRHWLSHEPTRSGRVIDKPSFPPAG